MNTVITQEKMHLPPGAIYAVQTSSRYFPNINILDIIQDCLQKSYQSNTSRAIRELRKKFPVK